MTELSQNPFAERRLKLAHGEALTLGPKAVIMGILNVTPDSFSDGGRYGSLDAAMEEAGKMAEEGAAIIDVGGESTRPGADAVSEAEEQDRVLPVIEALAKKGLLISIDSYRPATAKLAIEAGAHMINDVWGFQKDAALATVAAETGAGCCAMHTGRERDKLEDVIEDQFHYFRETLDILTKAGIGEDRILLDPGYGFAKDADENLELLVRTEELLTLGYPVMTGTSRKRFVGHFTGQPVDNRDTGTAATSVVARMKGSAVFRVHNVAVNRDALAIADAIIQTGIIDPHNRPSRT